MALKTDYKDDIFSGNRKYAQIDNGDGTISFTDQTEYDQVGDTFGATQINEIDGKINGHDTDISNIHTSISNLSTSVNTSVSELNNRTNVRGTVFYFDYQGGKWGWNSSPARGAGTFHPFNVDDLPNEVSVNGLAYGSIGIVVVPKGFFKNFNTYRVFNGVSGVETSGVGTVMSGFQNGHPATGSGLVPISLGTQYSLDKSKDFFTVRGDLVGDHLLGFTVVLYK